MRKLLITSVGLISAMAVFDQAIEPAFADEDVAKPRRERAQPRQAQPRQVAAPSHPDQQLERQPARRLQWRQLGQQRLRGTGGLCLSWPWVYRPGVFSCFENLLSFSDRPMVYTVGAFRRIPVAIRHAGGRRRSRCFVEGGRVHVVFREEGLLRRLVCDIYRDDVKHGSITQGWDASVRGRFGFLVTPWTLLYATAGVAFGEIKGSFSYSGVIFDSDCCGVLIPPASQEPRAAGRIFGLAARSAPARKPRFSRGSRRGSNTDTRTSAPIPRTFQSPPFVTLWSAAVPTRPAT